MIADEELSKGFYILKVIWVAMLVWQVIYLIGGLLVAPELEDGFDKDTLVVLRCGCYALAFVIIMSITIIRKLVLSVRNRVRPAIEGHRHPAIQKYTTVMIITWALLESIGIFGLVLFLLGKNSTDLFLPILISAGALVMYRPRKDEIFNLSEHQSTGAGF